MHYRFEIVRFGYYADPRNVIEIAKIADEAGWDGIWLSKILVQYRYVQHPKQNH